MEKLILKTVNLQKNYGKQSSINNLNMEIREGEIYGLIGKNGAGKTSFIRLITGLSKITSGEIKLFSNENIEYQRKRIGAVVEEPAFYGNLTAYENLEYYRILKGIPDKNIVNESLENVGLLDSNKKKVKAFSLGMKERLGLALAMLSKPDFIILDEPTNGLDPVGIIELRNTIKRLNEENNITFLISSHNLSELLNVATRFGILNKGRLIKEITKENLKIETKKCLIIKTEDIAKTTTIIETILNTINYDVLDGEIRLYDFVDKGSFVNKKLIEAGVLVDKIAEYGENLEEYFMSLLEEDIKC